MVKTLRRKFVLISMGALALILLVLAGTLNLANVIRVQKNADDLLDILAENDGNFPGEGVFDPRGAMGAPKVPDKPGSAPGGDNPPGGRGNARENRRQLFRDNELFGFTRTAETPFETRWFWARLDENGECIKTDTQHIAMIDEEQAQTIAKVVWQTGSVQKDCRSSGEARGTYENYRFLGRSAEGEVLIVFLDRQAEYHGTRLLFAVSLIVCAAMLALMFLMVTLLSSRAVAPTVEAFEKQKRFISDASHELKTPLSVISADVDVLEMTGEKSEWTTSIRDQVARMNQLIRDMLTLSRMEDEKLRVVFADVDLSAVVNKAAEPFFVVAKAAGKTFEKDVAEGVHLQGDADALAQLVSILSDNAMKHSAAGGSIQIRLMKEARGSIRLETANICERLPEGNLEHLFDRFYRADASRSKKTGGFGIGLSVARAITESHGGRIRAERDGDQILRFIAIFPSQEK
ncbi:MAG: HAMP domain-containing histidine kinase [Lachnospiraceae bacterium]|nr:HAMP domain-containing histidine kinase [Lachnospiraceae bacterium]